jgi:hypothetical protein
MSWPSLGLPLLVLALGTAGEPAQKKPVPVYTNDDLDRIAPRRDETGVNSTVAAPARPTTAAPREGDEDRARSEAYWRREGERHRVRQQRARARIESLRGRIVSLEAHSGPLSAEVRARRTAQVEGFRRQIDALDAQIREEEAQLADRARRAGALPGWLR